MKKPSPQEQRVFNLAVAGMSNKEIARELEIGVETVNTHLRHLRKKLDQPRSTWWMLRERITRDQVQPIIERLGKVSDNGWTFSDMGLMALISEVEDLVRSPSKPESAKPESSYSVGKAIHINLSDLDEFNKNANEKLEKMMEQVRSKH